MHSFKYKICSLAVLSSFFSLPAIAHDPVYGIGPHVLFKGGVDVAIEIDSKKAGDDEQQALALGITYGLTGDWVIGADLPYSFKDNGTNASSGLSDLSVFSKYRFWRKDSLGKQESAAVFMKVVTDTGNTSKSPSLGKESTDTIVGLAYGYESRRWYRWASARYRINGKNNNGVDRGDKILLDFVGGLRPNPSGYLEPDTVWLLELNGEYGKKADLDGATLANTGGAEWFVSPGIFWTKRNFAIKAGVQLPVSSRLNGMQSDSDYRVKVVIEWHT